MAAMPRTGQVDQFHPKDCSRRIFFVAEPSSEGLLTDPATAAQPDRWELVFLLRVFGRLPVSGVTRCSEAGVRKASGEETGGGFVRITG